MNSILNSRPILVVANSSWYLTHYRHLLLESLNDQFHVVAISPVDSTTPELAKILIHIPWRIHRSTDSNPVFLVVSFLRLLFLVRAIKPCLVHSHTLKANFLTAIVTAILGLPCVLSFAGMGRLSKSKGLSRGLFLLVLRTIAYFARHERSSRWSWQYSALRTALIFQNPKDQQLFHSACPDFAPSRNHLVPGSGVPERYFQLAFPVPKRNRWFATPPQHVNCDLLFCGRLLRTKGIDTFINLTDLLDGHRFTVFGSIDPSSKDSLSSQELSALKHINPRISFVGSKKDPLLQFFNSYPVLLVPSNYGEGLPRALAEALALEIPVICSRSATCGIFDDSIVYIADGDSAGDYLNSFDQLISDYLSGRLAKRLVSGRSLVEKLLSEKVIVQQTLSVYNQLESDAGKSYILSKDDERLKDLIAI